MKYLAVILVIYLIFLLPTLFVLALHRPIYAILLTMVYVVIPMIVVAKFRLNIEGNTDNYTNSDDQHTNNKEVFP